MDWKVIVACVVVIIFTLIAVTILEFNRNENNKPVQTERTLDQLPSLFRVAERCEVVGNETEYWVTTMSGNTYVLSSEQTSIYSVCRDDTTCTNQLISLSLTDDGLSPPVAKAGTIKYFPFIKGCSICDQCLE